MNYKAVHSVQLTNRIFRCRISLFGILLLAILLSTPTFASDLNVDGFDESQEWVPGEYIVKYNNNEIEQLRLLPDLSTYSEDEIKVALTAVLGAESKEHLDVIDAETIKSLEEDELDIEFAVALLDSQIAEYISPNYIRRLNRVPNDPSYSSLWGLNQLNNIDINAPEAWSKISDDETKDIIVGVIDTGVDYNHPDLKDNMWINPLESNGNANLDDDGNGVINDVYGYNAINNSGNPYDDNSHGTHCAGTIGAVGGNGIGITGVAWKVKIMALKFLSANGSGSDSNAIKTINYAINMKNVGGNLKVLNNSWGGSGYNPALKQAIEAANEAGILFVAAAGNDNRNNDISPTYPAGYDVPNIISVAAISQNGNRASFSNYGATKVHLAAPGVGILSTVKGGSYSSLNGTSMAAPHVSGVSVLAYGKMLSYAPAELRSHLMNHIKPLPQLQGLMIAPGIINAEAAVMSPDNYPPVLTPIRDQIVSPRIRNKSVALYAYDREGDPLTYEANIKIANYRIQAASIDNQYGFSEYLSQYDNYYGIGEKHLRSNSGKTYFIFSNGYIYELQFPYYSFRTQVDPTYYSNPNALVSAYPIDTSHLGKVELVNESSKELYIELAPGNQDGFDVEVKVSDGDRSHSNEFNVKLGESPSCR